MVRLKDLAERIGVSVMTVSKALRDEPDVSESTRAKIRALALQLGYVPDSSAQNLRTRRSRLLGLLAAICSVAGAKLHQRSRGMDWADS